jgi:hypothetical protein
MPLTRQLTWEKAVAARTSETPGTGGPLGSPSTASMGGSRGTHPMGLVLFPSQHKAVLSSPATNNPLYLRVLLNALHWSASRGLDLWRLFADWIQAEVRATLGA